MKILIVTFDHNYYLWQCLVQINNLIKYGYDVDTSYIISTHHPSPALNAMMKSDKIKSDFYIYKDERVNSKYPVSLRHYLLEKFFTDNPEFEKETIFLIDPDVVFTKKLDFTEMKKDDYWHLSDTRSYIDSNYIKRTSEKLFNEMCEIAKVTPEQITSNDNNAGGAQYLMKGINADFWKKSYTDSEKLYVHMKNTENLYTNKIQSWTSDMWSILWNGIYFGHKIKINRKLDFCWAPWNIKKWDETYIFHNAGIMEDNNTDFSKIKYQNSPFNQELIVNKNNCTYNYVKEIKDTEKNFQDLIKLSF